MPLVHDANRCRVDEREHLGPGAPPKKPRRKSDPAPPKAPTRLHSNDVKQSIFEAMHAWRKTKTSVRPQLHFSATTGPGGAPLLPFDIYPADGSLGRPRALIDGGGHEHLNLGYSLLDARSIGCDSES